MWWQLWWVWMVVAGVLGILEVILPGFILLGFAVGAVVTGLLVAVSLLGGSLAPMLFVFAVASLGGWYVLRAVFGPRNGAPKVWEKDINEN
jgi:membrane protein implicated in regulation of membrane protease activity